jgi:hypothetical protein
MDAIKVATSGVMMKPAVGPSNLYTALVPCPEVDFGPIWGEKCKERAVYFYATSFEDAEKFLDLYGLPKGRVIQFQNEGKT